MEYRWIVGYEDRFDISEYGQIRSYFGCNGTYFRRKKVLYIIGKVSNKGYHIARVGNMNSVYTDKHHVAIHIEVAKAYIPNPLGLPQVNHIDGNKLNNHFSNLEWCTCSQNVRHAYKLGLRSSPVGERMWSSKLKNCQVLEIYKSDLAEIKSISKKYSITEGCVLSIKNGLTWRHITGQEKIKPEPRKVINPETVVSIFNATGSYKEIAEFHNVEYHDISPIKNRKRYSLLTKDL